MGRVDFYVLSDDAPDDKLRVACRLIEKAFDSGARVYAHAASLSEAQRLDELLWTFSDRTFIPHEVTDNGTASHERVMVLIGTEGAPVSHRQILVNLTSSLPAEI